jgi:hypothetical protein
VVQGVSEIIRGSAAARDLFQLLWENLKEVWLEEMAAGMVERKNITWVFDQARTGVMRSEGKENPNG